MTNVLPASPHFPECSAIVPLELSSVQLMQMLSCQVEPLSNSCSPAAQVLCAVQVN